MLRLIVGTLAAAVLAAGPLGADVVKLQPNASVAVDVEGATWVVVKYDLSGIPAGARILEATLDWTVPGVDEEAFTEFSARAATASWTETSVQGTGVPAAREVLAAEWSIAPRDYERTGGLVRFRLRDLVRAWHSGSLANHGLVLEMAGLGAESLGSALGQAVLAVHYRTAN
jgi:hypothetical protein